MDDGFFRELSETEVEEFKQWARDNHKIGDEVSEVWHPVIRKECKLIDEEHDDEQASE